MSDVGVGILYLTVSVYFYCLNQEKESHTIVRAFTYLKLQYCQAWKVIVSPSMNNLQSNLGEVSVFSITKNLNFTKVY